VNKEADYVLAVKQNQGQLFEDLKDLFAVVRKPVFVQMARTITSRPPRKGMVELRFANVGRAPMLSFWII